METIKIKEKIVKYFYISLLWIIGVKKSSYLINLRSQYTNRILDSVLEYVEIKRFGVNSITYTRFEFWAELKNSAIEKQFSQGFFSFKDLVRLRLAQPLLKKQYPKLVK
jgi:hypothetical protein